MRRLRPPNRKRKGWLKVLSLVSDRIKMGTMALNSQPCAFSSQHHMVGGDDGKYSVNFPPIKENTKSSSNTPDLKSRGGEKQISSKTREKGSKGWWMSAFKGVQNEQILWRKSQDTHLASLIMYETLRLPMLTVLSSLEWGLAPGVRGWRINKVKAGLVTSVDRKDFWRSL